MTIAAVLAQTTTIPMTQAQRIRGGVAAVPPSPPSSPTPPVNHDGIVNKNNNKNQNYYLRGSSHGTASEATTTTWLSWPNHDDGGGSSSSSSSSLDYEDKNRILLRQTTTPTSLFLQDVDALVNAGEKIHIVLSCNEDLKLVKEVMLQEGINLSSVSWHISDDDELCPTWLQQSK
jgi:hypothetical protein